MAAPPGPAPPPPPASAPSPSPYAGWSSPSATPAYRGPVLPPWLTVGAMVVLAGGVLIFAGFLIEAVGTNAYAGSAGASSLSAYFDSMEWSEVLVGLGVLVAAIGWLLHQMGVHRRSAR
jgi:hypothetical protein